MFGKTWHHDTLRKYVILFGTLFNNIYITRNNLQGDTIQTLKVPLSYGPKEKFLARLDGDPNLDKKIAIQLPRMSFEMTSFLYDSDRKLNPLNRYYKQDGDNVNYQYSPVPYNINFQLSIMVKNVEDGTRIVEQILPYFTPSWNASVKLVQDVDMTMDIPIVLDNISCEDTYQGDFETRRAIIWTLEFTMKGYVFGPTKKGAKVIKFVEGNIYDMNSNSMVATVTAQPGLTVDGDPTTDITQTIDYIDINSTDNYAFINDFIENT